MLAPAERLFTAQEAAERLGVHERTVRRWIEAGRLPAAKQGAAFAIRPEDVEMVGAGAMRRRLVDRSEEHARDATLLELQGQFKLLKEMYDRLEADLVEERRKVARLEIQLEAQAA